MARGPTGDPDSHPSSAANLARRLQAAAGTHPQPQTLTPGHVQPAPPRSRPPTVTPAPVTVARSALADSVASATGSAASAAGSAAAAAFGGGGHGGGGSDSDSTYNELVERLRQEQEQLGRLIQHPF